MVQGYSRSGEQFAEARLVQHGDAQSTRLVQLAARLVAHHQKIQFFIHTSRRNGPGGFGQMLGLAALQRERAGEKYVFAL